MNKAQLVQIDIDNRIWHVIIDALIVVDEIQFANLAGVLHYPSNMGVVIREHYQMIKLQLLAYLLDLLENLLCEVVVNKPLEEDRFNLFTLNLLQYLIVLHQFIYQSSLVERGFRVEHILHIFCLNWRQI